MPRYAIVTVVDAREPEEAWKSISERLLDESRGGYLCRSPLARPRGPGDELAEFETDGIQLRLDGKRVTLGPVD